MDPLQYYLSIWRAGGDDAVAARWPDDPFVATLGGRDGPPSESTRRYYSPEAIRVLGCPSRESDCNCLNKDAACKRDEVRTTLPRCLACVSVYPIEDRQPDSGPRRVPTTPSR